MRIVIVGAGKLGYSIAELLSGEQNDVVVIDRDKETLVSGPDIVSRGFIYVRENEDTIDNVQTLVRKILSSNSLNGENWGNLKNIIKDEVHNYIFEKIKRNPMILPIILDV